MPAHRPHRPNGFIGHPDPNIRAIFERAKELGVSDAELSRRTSYDPGTVSAYRRGDWGVNRYTIVRDLATAVGLELVVRQPKEA